MSDNHKDVLDTDAEGGEHPKDKKTFVLSFGSKNKHQGTSNSSKPIKNCILDERSYTDIFPVTFISIACEGTFVSDYIENSGNDGNYQLNISNN